MNIMKRKLLSVLSFCVWMALATWSHAQDVPLLPDQNPRYAESVNKYSKMADSLTQTQGTTVQQTYKAYDWYEAREERRRLRRERNYQYSFSPAYGYGNYWYNPGYGYSSYLYPSIGFRTGNWWFGW
jgi:hypothetical protein